MKRKLILNMMALTLSALSLSAQAFEWTKSGGTSDDDFVPFSVVDPSGNTWSVNNYTGFINVSGFTFNSNAGSQDFIITKFNKFGTCVYAQSIGGPEGDAALDIQITMPGGILITGSTRGTVDFLGTEITSAGSADAFVALLDKKGNLVWIKTIEGDDFDYFSNITSDKAGNIYATGPFESTVTFAGSTFLGDGHAATTVAKYNASGTEIWMRRFDGTSAWEDSWPQGIEVDKDQNVYITGYYYDTLIVGAFTLTEGNPHMYIAKLNNVGTPIWAKDLNGYEGAFYSTMDGDRNGNMYIAGQFNYEMTFGGHFITTGGGFNYNAYIARINNATGNVDWINQVECADNSIFHDINVVNPNLILATGSFQESAAYDDLILSNEIAEYDGMIVKIDPTTGAGMQTFSMGSDVYCTAQEIGYDKEGNVYVSGGFYDSMTLPGTFTVNSMGGGDSYWTKLPAFLPRENDENNLMVNNLSTISVYPNPAVETININYIANENSNATINIHNTNGAHVYSEIKEIISGTNTFEVNVQDLPAGLYYVEINELTQQFVKIK